MQAAGYSMKAENISLIADLLRLQPFSSCAVIMYNLGFTC